MEPEQLRSFDHEKRLGEFEEKEMFVNEGTESPELRTVRDILGLVNWRSVREKWNKKPETVDKSAHQSTNR